MPKTTSPTKKNVAGFSEDERAAMKARALELRAEERMNKNRAEGERILLEAIAAMPEPDRSMASRLHEVVTAGAPVLAPKTWYGMPAYAKDGKVVCFFQSGKKFKSRYSSFGFNDAANLDEDDIWPVAFALKKLTPEVEKKIAMLVKKAVS